MKIHFTWAFTADRGIPRLQKINLFLIVFLKFHFAVTPGLFSPSLYSFLCFLHSEFGPQTSLQIKAVRPFPLNLCNLKQTNQLTHSTSGLIIKFFFIAVFYSLPENPHSKKSWFLLFMYCLQKQTHWITIISPLQQSVLSLFKNQSHSTVLVTFFYVHFFFILLYN